MSLKQIFLVVAIVLFAIAAIYAPTTDPAGRPGWPRVWLGWLGMAFFAASFLV